MPSIFFENNNSNTLLIWALYEDVESFQNLVDVPIYLEILNTIRLEKRKLEKLSQVMLLKQAGIPYEMLFYLPNGKPKLRNGKYVSFSHSGKLSALLIAENNCGIDIEYPSDKILKIAPKFINKEEERLLKENENVYWIWSIKEAIFKFFGERVLFKDHIKILSTSSIHNEATVLYDGFHGKGIFVMHLMRVKKYYLAYTKSYAPE
jgi:phosphopantetheinyl transferase